MSHLAEIISALLDGELEVPEAAAAEQHLADCAACRIEYEEVRAGREAVRSLPEREPAAPLIPGSTVGRRPRWAWASAAAVGLVLGSGLLIGPGEPGVAFDTAALAGQHTAALTPSGAADPDAPSTVTGGSSLDPGARGRLPEAVAGYARRDARLTPGGVSHGVYTDGAATFSVFEADRGATPEPFPAADRWSFDGHEYLAVGSAAEVLIHWNAPDSSFLVVGPLTRDQARLVLADLPRPGDRSLLVRIWRRLFG